MGCGLKRLWPFGGGAYYVGVTLCTVTLLVVGGCSERDDNEMPVADEIQSVDFLPVGKGTIHVLADDVDGNGLTDLVFTSHGGNFSQAFFQRDARTFEAGPEEPVVDFHPNDLIRLPTKAKRYLANAESAGRLMVLEPAADGGFDKIAELPAPEPRATTPFFWPGWGMGLFMAPYAGNTVWLYRDFKPATAAVAQSYEIAVPRGHTDTGAGLAVDLDGDDIKELVFTVHRKNEVWRLAYPGDKSKPTPTLLWSGGNAFSGYQLEKLDIDRDGDMDLLVPQANNKAITVLSNDGAGRFTEAAPIPFEHKPGPRYIAVAESSSTGERFMAASGYKVLGLYRWTADGERQQVSIQMKDWASYLTFEDVDSDGHLDLVAALERNDQSGVLFYGPLWPAFQALSKRDTPL